MKAANCWTVACAMCILVSTGARSDPTPKAMSANDGQMRPSVEAFKAKPAPPIRPQASYGAEKVKSGVAKFECAVCAVQSQIEKKEATERARNEAIKRKGQQQQGKLDRNLEKTVEQREQQTQSATGVLR